ncbi:SxtJ family membrane protein [bacterium]|nr:SxtJ family membrane protein [bacterium]
MIWINDVKDELIKLDQSAKGLKKFGLLVGGVFCVITLWMVYKNSHSILKYILGCTGGLLILFGIIYPCILKPFHKIWMGLAFGIGWFVSRFLLILLFIGVTIPIGIIMRFLGKDLINHKIEKERTSYWIPKKNQNESHFEKMY